MPTEAHKQIVGMIFANGMHSQNFTVAACDFEKAGEMMSTLIARIDEMAVNGDQRAAAALNNAAATGQADQLLALLVAQDSDAAAGLDARISREREIVILALLCGDAEQAEVHLKHILQLRPDDYDANMCMGSLYRLCYRFKDAEAALRTALETSADGTRDRSDVLEKLADIQQAGNNNEAAESLLTQALAIRTSLGEDESCYTLYSNLSRVCRDLEQLDRAESYTRKAMAIAEKEQQPLGMAAQYSNLGSIYWRRGDLDRADAMHKKALAISQSLNVQHGIANQYAHLSLVSKAKGNLDAAEEYLLKSLEIDENLGRQDTLARGYANLGDIYLKQKELEKAESSTQKALSKYEALDSPSDIADMCLRLADIRQKRDNLDGAEEALRKALAICVQLGQTEMIIRAWYELGMVQERQGNMDDAEQCFVKSLRLAEKTENHHYMGLCNIGLARVYLNRGEYEWARTYVRQARKSAIEIGDDRLMQIADTLFDKILSFEPVTTSQAEGSETGS